MKFHICSDFHLDYNQGDFAGEEPNRFLLDDCYNLIAGDLSGYDTIRQEWLSKQIAAGKIGAFVLGNHDCIYQTNPNKLTYPQMVDKVMEEFGNTPLVFLNNTYVYFPDEDIVLWGATFWTDFKYGYKGNASINGYWAEHGMNDFRFELWPREDGEGLRCSRWEDFAALHDKSLESLTKCIEEHPHSRFVVLTHHAPSRQSIDSNYINSDLNAAYVSDLEGYILEHPQIKLWVHGHIHSHSRYKIGECEVIANPFGYRRYYEDVGYIPDLIVEV